MTEIGNAHRVGHITTEIEIRLSIFWLLGIRVSQEESPLFRAGRMSIAIAIIILSGIDSTFTLMILDAGGSEENVVLNWIIDNWGEDYFIYIKWAMTTFGAITLSILHDKKLFGIPIITIMELIVLGYCALLIYELEILFTIYQSPVA